MTTLYVLCAITFGLATLMSALYFRERQHRLRQSSAPACDLLTGLLTRHALDLALREKIQKVDRGGGHFCILYIALNNLRLLNEAFGHDVADKVIKEVSQRLAECAGPKAQACRIAAAEFAIIVNGGKTVGRAAAKRVNEAFSRNFDFDSTPTLLSCCIGIATYPEHGPGKQIFENAGLAMRTINRRGGGDCCEYQLEMGERIRDQTLLTTDLRRALEMGQFELYFQPRVDSHSLQFTAAEALLRWKHPQRGFVSPLIFIPLAERYGMIGAMGNWVIEEAARCAAQWLKSGLRMRVAVNISGVQMLEQDLVERIEDALRRHGIPAARFTCEIKESEAMKDPGVTRRTFEKMRAAGLIVSIDDFGTGYSSPSVLRSLPAAELKIDGAFVCDLEQSEDARLIARSMINMAAALKLRVVAKGVETTGQRDLLVEMGCNELQGFLFSKPIPANDLEWLARDEHGAESNGFRHSLFWEAMHSELK